ncbi:hypothetical protein [Pedobacter frigiditerrae]|uniref:hypothetical protein n=1 Tax=Pedobacter frigiditerrae TaxID=2530452 RepID=UPI00292F0163|nr:hypothetical protein [Pedobacter frigiditerrae]
MNTTIRIKVTNNAKLSEVFLNGLIPDNSDIDKTETGNGLTTAEIKAPRNSIIINPQVNTIILKAKEWEAKGHIIASIYHKQSEDITAFLKSNQVNKKIFVTPESFPVLIKKASDAGLLKMLQDEFFCLLDESHCYASEKFRKMILNPINHVFQFKKIAMGSATPFPYTDPRIIKLQKYKIVYGGSRGKVNIISCKKPRTALEELIKKNNFKGNVHVFFNSVTECFKVVKNTGITDVNIFCADGEENHIKLFNLNQYFKAEPKRGEYKRFNLYTCRYIEGWDMFDNDNTTIIIVTDTARPHTLISIPIKAVQCIGRLRDKKPHEILHITNDFNKEKHFEETFAQIEKRVMFEAVDFVKIYKEHRNSMVQAGIAKPSMMDEFISQYTTNELGIPELAHFKVNQFIYEAWTLSHYTNINALQTAWKEANYKTKLYGCELDVEECKDESKQSINKYVIDQFIEYRNNPEKYKYGTASLIIQKLENKYSVLFQSVLILGIARIKQLNYDDELMKTELIQLNNRNALNKITAELDKILNVNCKYLKSFLKEALQPLYVKYEYLDNNGNVMKAKANQLETLGLYQIKEDRLTDNNGKRQAAFKIEGKNFELIA